MKAKHKVIYGNSPNEVDKFLTELMKKAKRPINELVLGITYDAEWRRFTVFYLDEE